MESEAFLKRDVASNALTLVESEQDKLEREIRRDKWMQYPIRDIAELLSSTQITIKHQWKTNFSKCSYHYNKHEEQRRQYKEEKNKSSTYMSKSSRF
ncbi:hypothetical protein Bca4012_001225 [Brassica carinata]